MTARQIILKTHLYLGLAAAAFLVVLGLTGSIMAFEGDIDHWVHPRAWYVAAGEHPLAEADLIAKVEQAGRPARVAGIQILPQRNLAQSMQLTDRSSVTVNPYDGSILSRVHRPEPNAKAPRPDPPVAPASLARAASMVRQSRQGHHQLRRVDSLPAGPDRASSCGGAPNGPPSLGRRRPGSGAASTCTR